jgi:hypothetical protein
MLMMTRNHRPARTIGDSQAIMCATTAPSPSEDDQAAKRHQYLTEDV